MLKNEVSQQENRCSSVLYIETKAETELERNLPFAQLAKNSIRVIRVGVLNVQAQELKSEPELEHSNRSIPTRVMDSTVGVLTAKPNICLTFLVVTMKFSLLIESNSHGSFMKIL